MLQIYPKVFYLESMQTGNELFTNRQPVRGPVIANHCCKVVYFMGWLNYFLTSKYVILTKRR